MPEQIEVAEAVILSDGVTALVTVMVIPELVAEVGLGQAALLCITQVTILPLLNVDELNEALLVPAFTPFTFH